MALCDPDGPWHYGPRLSLDDFEDSLRDDFDWSCVQ
jgi:hypothetical protein